MDKLNAQQTWPSIPGSEKNAGTDTVDLIFHKYKPQYRRATYVREVCNIRTQKTENHRTRLTAGVNMIYYLG